MTAIEIQAEINYLLGEAERERFERRCYKEMNKDGYKWYISPDVVTQLEWEAYKYPIRLSREEPITLCGIPVQIDYQAREKIELWRRIERED